MGKNKLWKICDGMNLVVDEKKTWSPDKIHVMILAIQSWQGKVPRSSYVYILTKC